MMQARNDLEWNRNLAIYTYPPLSFFEKIVRRDRHFWAHTQYTRDFRDFFAEYRSAPEEADFFFVPINLIHSQFYHADSPDPGEVIKALPFLAQGRHLILATGDYGQRRRSSYESQAPGRAYPELYEWLTPEISLLAFESTADLLDTDIGILPYGLSTPPSRPRSWRTRLWPGAEQAAMQVERFPRCRDLLFSFCGALSYTELPDTHVRGQRLARLAGKGDDWFVGSLDDAKRCYGGSTTFASIMRRSVFTLCPAGYGRWTFRLVEAICHGSIPVIVSDGYLLPFAETIPWEALSVRVPESELEQAASLLHSLSDDRIRSLQASLRKHSPYFDKSGVQRLVLNRLCSMAGTGQS